MQISSLSPQFGLNKTETRAWLLQQNLRESSEKPEKQQLLEEIDFEATAEPHDLFENPKENKAQIFYFGPSTLSKGAESLFIYGTYRNVLGQLIYQVTNRK